ncbi:hypothetical protein LWI29_027621 [Acer saccharum]|uniref:Uncharacterized protein n=1 Tax=Acer saccharum TaxID=4024 RepID=A0AA39RND4_ACESA|nr:hypothetical protein LWI29_027621 [Acer saccharum]
MTKLIMLVLTDGLVIGFDRNGDVNIEGVMPASCGILENSSSVFQMHVEQICPPRPFCISFSFPGEVDACMVMIRVVHGQLHAMHGRMVVRVVTSTYLPGAILEVTVGKRQFPDTTPKMAEEQTKAASLLAETERIKPPSRQSSRSLDFYLWRRFSTGTLIGS